MGFSQMKQLIKLNINSQNDNYFLIKWNILNAYYILTSHLQFYFLPTYLPRCTTYLPTHPRTHLDVLLTCLPTHPPMQLPCHQQTYLID